MQMTRGKAPRAHPFVEAPPIIAAAYGGFDVDGVILHQSK
jgi:hypothetical protein